MISFKKIISSEIAKIVKFEEEEIYSYIEVPSDNKLGDYAFPCFRLAKILKKSPQIIAEDIKEKLVIDHRYIEKVEIVSGYINFYINKNTLIQIVLKELNDKKQLFGSSNIGSGKKVIIDYSHPNIAKPFHIGHLRSTVIGQALYNIYKFLGYDVKGLNYLGDYGTQFGKIIEGYKLWGQDYNIDENPIEELTKIYVRINDLCKKDEQVLEACRNNFKLLEEGDKYCTELWHKFRELSLKEFKKIYDLLGGKFDSWDGEASIAPKVPEVLELLEKSGKLINSEGAKIIDLEDKNMAPCIIEKTNGSSTYASRDLAAILYRAKEYDFDKALYITSYEQTLHFRQVFEVAKLLGIDEKYTNGLVHVPFGMVLLKTGKMSTREGTFIKLEDLLNESIKRAKDIIKQKNEKLENEEETAKKVGIGAIIFNDLSNNRIKDEIFDWDTILNFNGETGPYVQYTYVRTKSILDNVDILPDINSVKNEQLNNDEAIKILKLLYNYQNIIIQSAERNEPSILTRFIIELSKAYSSFYNEYKIITNNVDEKNARLYLTYATGLVLKSGMELLGIEMPYKM